MSTRETGMHGFHIWRHGCPLFLMFVLLVVVSGPPRSLAQEKVRRIDKVVTSPVYRLSVVDAGYQSSPHLKGGTATFGEVHRFWWRFGVGLSAVSIRDVDLPGHDTKMWTSDMPHLISYLSPSVLVNCATGRAYALNVGARGCLLNGVTNWNHEGIPPFVEGFTRLNLGVSGVPTLFGSLLFAEIGYRSQIGDSAIFWHDGGWYAPYDRQAVEFSGYYFQLGLCFAFSWRQQSTRRKTLRLPDPDLKAEFRPDVGILPLLSPGQGVELVVRIDNPGAGIAEDVTVRVEVDQELEGVEVRPLSKSVGDIRPGESANVRIAIKNVYLETATNATYTVQAYEKDGFKSNPVSQVLQFGPEKPPLPGHITVEDRRFEEPSGNGVLDAEEGGWLVLEVRNDGLGRGRVRVKLKPLTDVTHLRFDQDIDVGILDMGQSQTITIPFGAGFGIGTGSREFRVEVIEEYYSQVIPFSLTFDTKAFMAPRFRVIVRDYNDGVDIYQGNKPDGAITAGEVVRVEANIQNIGEGEGRDVRAEVKVLRDGQDVHYRRDLSGATEHTFLLGEMARGEDRDIAFYFFTNPDFRRDTVTVRADITESYGKFGTSETFDFLIGRGVATEEPLTVKALHEVVEVDVVQPDLVDIDTPPSGSKTKLKDGLAVVFGVERYKHTFDAAYKHRDAAVFYRYCRDVFGIPEDRIYLALDDGATKAEFEYVFEPKDTERDGWLKKRLGDPDMAEEADVIVYIGGHGYPDFTTGQPYFIPYDVRPEQATNGVSLDWLYQTLAGYGARSVIVFVEACFCGVSGYRKGMQHEPLLAGTNPVAVEAGLPALSGKNMVVYLATSGEHPSNNRNDLKHGIFTYYVLKGIGRAADEDGDRSITVEELYSYLRREVPRKAYEPPLDRAQTPETIPPLSSMDNSLKSMAVVRY